MFAQLISKRYNMQKRGLIRVCLEVPCAPYLGPPTWDGTGEEGAISSSGWSLPVYKI